MSLNPGAQRRALNFDIYLDDRGEVVSSTALWIVMVSIKFHLCTLA
eukprot:SAG31_NODE_1774_length_7303_cov_4.685453_5_plen_46_part_00